MRRVIYTYRWSDGWTSNFERDLDDQEWYLLHEYAKSGDIMIIYGDKVTWVDTWYLVDVDCPF